jgi:hypothetical protein
MVFCPQGMMGFCLVNACLVKFCEADPKGFHLGSLRPGKKKINLCVLCVSVVNFMFYPQGMTNLSVSVRVCLWQNQYFLYRFRLEFDRPSSIKLSINISMDVPKILVNAFSG